MPGSPSQAGSKPGDVCQKASTKQLVASRGRGGSNPPPGASQLIEIIVIWSIVHSFDNLSIL